MEHLNKPAKTKMQMQYAAETDTLAIVFEPVPYQHGGAVDADRDVVLHFTTEGKLAEIEIERASKRVDLDTLRQGAVWEEL